MRFIGTWRAKMTGFMILAWCLSGLLSAWCESTPPNQNVTEEKQLMVGPSQAGSSGEYILLPKPRRIQFLEGHYACSEKSVLTIEGVDRDGTRLFEKIWNHLFPPGGERPATHLRIDPASIIHKDGYRLLVDQNGVWVTARDNAGLYYGLMTLRQLQRQASPSPLIPNVHIEDWPDFPSRGVLLDISRDKVPEMETLYRLVDLLSEWKINQLQLYTEHTFAYRNHPVVWQDASPMTPHQIRALDAYCQEHFILLVPNQNSFGHMERWLKHERYLPLAEMPEGGMDLCAVDPGSIALLGDMYADSLPNFSSPLFNVGCDETWTLGKGRSKEATDKQGVGRVYLEFLLKIHELVTEQGRRMQFWGDIIMQHPELIGELPKDVIAMEWGYEDDHPFAEHGQKFADSGIPFYVCPGSSSWNSLIGRTDNALGNLRNAARNGLHHGAIGYLITDWGDGGHWQFLPVSYAGFAFGAGVSWCYDSNTEMPLARALDVHVFKDSSNTMGQAVLDLGNVYQKTGVLAENNTLYYLLLQHSIRGGIEGTALAGMTMENLDAASLQIEQIKKAIQQADMQCEEAGLIRQEFLLGSEIALLALDLGRARLAAGGVGTEQLPLEKRNALADKIDQLLPEYRQLWLARNRSGGLKDSAGRFEALSSLLRAGS